MTDQVKDREVRDRELREQHEREQRRVSTADVAQAAQTQPVRREEVHGQQAGSFQSDRVPLLPGEQTTQLRTRWDSIQTSFVDEPRKAVEEADALVAEIMQNLARSFADERQNLENQWGRGDNVSTEDLRIALQRYRSFFSRLLSI